MINFPEEFVTYAGYLWLIAAIALLFFELNTPGLFYFISFALGAFCASILAFSGFSLIIQCLGGLGASIATFVVLRTYLKQKRMSDVSFDHTKMNIDALAGKQGVVINNIPRHGFGSVKIEGELWRAKSVNDTPFNEGTRVSVLRVEGNTVIVKPLMSGDEK
jgi:membrane protein implicated in regulation of membrane protease activity